MIRTLILVCCVSSAIQLAYGGGTFDGGEKGGIKSIKIIEGGHTKVVHKRVEINKSVALEQKHIHVKDVAMVVRKKPGDKDKHNDCKCKRWRNDARRRQYPDFEHDNVDGNGCITQSHKRNGPNHNHDNKDKDRGHEKKDGGERPDQHKRKHDRDERDHGPKDGKGRQHHDRDERDNDPKGNKDKQNQRQR